MPDPIEELENFTVPGPTMNPMPASEVRRRGTRLRRRNNALATVGGLAVVAVIATPFAVLAGHQGSSAPQPAPAPDISWKQEIPPDFPLNQDMFSEPKVTDASGVDDIALCGTTVWSPEGSVDVAGASSQGLEEQAGRTLALYPDDEAAGRALAAIRSGIDECPRDENGSGLPLVQAPITADLGGDESFAFMQRAKNGSSFSELSLWEVVRSGNALYLDFSYGSAADDQTVGDVAGTMGNRSESVRGQLCTFSADGCADRGEDAGNEPPASIPDDLDLLAGLPEETDPRFGAVGPNRQLPAIDLTACDRAAPEASTTDRLRADFNQASGQRQRQLMLFADQEAAETWLNAASDSFVGCERDGGQGVVGRYDVSGSDLGQSARTVTLRHYVDGEPGLGHQIIELVRVGAAVLVASTSVDGSSVIVTDQRLAELASTSRGEAQAVVEQMCAFAAAC